ncbi:DUF1133 family protein [Hafnia paralvei]
MFYPDSVAKADGADLKLRTLEKVWIQGRLRMWGRWATFGKSSEASGILSRLIAEPTVSKAALKRAMTQLKKTGLNEAELLAFFEEMRSMQAVSNLTFCTDDEGLKMNRVIADVLSRDRGLLNILRDHYCYRRKRYPMAENLHEKHPEISLITCRRRIDTWLNTAEYMLYKPMYEAFRK